MAKLQDSFFGRKRWYLADESDKVIAEKDAAIKDLQTRLIAVGQIVQKRDQELDTIKGKFQEFNNGVCKKIIEASQTMSAISQDAQMDFYEEFIKEA